MVLQRSNTVWLDTPGWETYKLPSLVTKPCKRWMILQVEGPAKKMFNLQKYPEPPKFMIPLSH